MSSSPTARARRSSAEPDAPAGARGKVARVVPRAADPGRSERDRPLPDAAPSPRRRRKVAGAPAPPPPSALSSRTVGDEALVAGVRVTHPERLLYPEAGITKLDVARYYASMAPHILPYIRNRPLSLVRCPRGPASACFFQKHATERDIPGIGFVMITESGGEKPYVIANCAQALAGAAQMNTLELHAWNATADDVERADTMVFDFDPDPAVPFGAVAAAAVQCRSMLTALGLVSFVKTTGGKGLHVVVPLSRRVPWDTVKTFARGVAEHLANRFPGRFTTRAAKALRKERIFIDYLRNARGATAVAPFSVRARHGATVAVPLYWNELSEALQPAAFDVRTVQERVARGGDAWAGYSTTRQTITAEMQRRLQRA